MPWSTDITVANVRAECPLITDPPKTDAQVQSAIDQAKAWIEGALRAADYASSDPSLDKSVWLTGVGMACYVLLHQMYGTEAWDDEGRSMAREYYGRWKFLVEGMANGTFCPNLTKTFAVPVPEFDRPEYEDPDDPLLWPFELRTNIDDSS